MPAHGHTILAVEDTKYMQKLLQDVLRHEGYRVLLAEDGASAIELAADPSIALILLDLLLPDIHGLDVCRRIREFSTVPIIMLTAHDKDDLELRGFDHGADDYIRKPYDSRVLLARVEANIRRAAKEPVPVRPPYVCRDLRVEFTTGEVTRGGVEIGLTPTERKLLIVLASNAGRVLTYDFLLERVWGPGYDDRGVVHTFVGRLRKKIETDPAHPEFVLHRDRVGYWMPRPDSAADHAV